METRSCVVAIHQPEFLPWLGFMDKVGQCDVFVLLDHVQFRKNYFQNRNRIRTPTAQGWSWLTVPVRLKGRFGQPICEVEIDHGAGWRRKHLATIKLHYQRAPYFERYWPSLQACYEPSWRRLADFSVALVDWCIGMLGLQRTFVRSSTLGIEGSRSAMLRAICQRVGATEYLSGVSGRAYLDAGMFQQAGIPVRFQEFFHPIYHQCYEPFVPGLSCLDLLFNHGPEALAMLGDHRTPRLSAVFV